MSFYYENVFWASVVTSIAEIVCFKANSPVWWLGIPSTAFSDGVHVKYIVTTLTKESIISIIHSEASIFTFCMERGPTKLYWYWVTGE